MPNESCHRLMCCEAASGELCPCAVVSGGGRIKEVGKRLCSFYGGFHVCVSERNHQA